MGTTGYERFAVLFLLALAGIVLKGLLGIAAIVWLAAIGTVVSKLCAIAILAIMIWELIRYD